MEEDMIIETLRMDDVVDLVKKFVASNRINPNYANVLFDKIYKKNCPLIRSFDGTTQMSSPQNVLYDKIEVMSFLDNFQKKLNNPIHA